MLRRRSLERQTVRSVPIGRPCDERSLASCVQTVAWRSRISQRGRRKHPSQIALGAHRATFGHWLNLFHGGSRDHRSARCYRQSKCTSLRQPCAPTAIGEGGFCSGLFITHLLPLDTSSWLSLDFAAPFGQVRALLIRLSNCLRACMEESWKNRDAGSQDGETRPFPAQNTFDTAATASFLASRLTCV